MHHKLKLSIVLLSVIFFFSFSVKENSNTYSKSDFTTKAGDTITWKLLAEIKFESKKHSKYGEVQFPIVNDKVKLRGKKKVYISGFIVPIDNKSYALSKNVFASCFFCGKSGPESIVGLQFKNGTPKLKTDQYVTVEGTFRYNENDVDDWIYNMDNVVIVKGN